MAGTATKNASPPASGGRLLSDELEIGVALDRARERLHDQAGGYLTVPEVADLARCEHKAVRRAIATGLIGCVSAGAEAVGARSGRARLGRISSGPCPGPAG